jgi:hypothetical protein
MARPSRGLVRVLSLVALAAACGKGGGDAMGQVVAAWEKAGLAPGKLEPVDGKALHDGTCRQGAVSGIGVTLCEYGDAAAASRAEPAGLAQVTDVTGLAIAQGKLLLVVADRDRKDPSGKRINEIARAFRDR